MKATPNTIASDTNNMCPTSVSNADDTTVASSSQNKGAHINYSSPTTKDPPKGQTTAVIAAIRNKPTDGYHHHQRNKHYKWTLVRVLLDSGSDRDLVFVSKDRSKLLPYLKRLVTGCDPSWRTFLCYWKFSFFVVSKSALP